MPNHNNHESRFHDPKSALAVAQETSSAVAAQRNALYRELDGATELAQRHGNFTEHSGVPHRHENGHENGNGNGALPTAHAQQLGHNAINGAPTS